MRPGERPVPGARGKAASGQPKFRLGLDNRRAGIIESFSGPAARAVLLARRFSTNGRELTVDLDFSPFFKKYEALVAEVDAVFKRVEEAHPECVKCRPGCSDCCHAMFDLSLVEALYLNGKFNQAFGGQRRSDLLDRCGEADREAYRIKRDVFRKSREGAKAAEVMELIGKARVRCPLLDEEDRCVLYEHRPVTCRLYGVPTAIGGKAHTCGKTGFEPGGKYPTVHIEKIQDRLAMLSAQLTATLRTRYTRLHETFVPVSMALMNAYDDEYLGLIREEEWEKIQQVRQALDGQQEPPKERGAAKDEAPEAPPMAPQPSACASCSEKQGSSACSTCGSLNWEFGSKGGK